VCFCRLVADAASGKHFEPVPCAPPPVHGKMDVVLPEKVLKVSPQLKCVWFVKGFPHFRGLIISASGLGGIL